MGLRLQALVRFRLSLTNLMQASFSSLWASMAQWGNDSHPWPLRAVCYENLMDSFYYEMLTTQNYRAGKETGIVGLHCIRSRLISVPLIHTPRQVVLWLIFRHETELGSVTCPRSQRN